MAEGQRSLQKETGSLVTALRAPHVRGRWGEVQLKRVVEMAGMLAHCDFVEQPSERDDEGRLLRPDLVVKLPGGKSIVIDSKAPLDAYLDAAAAEDDESRRTHLARHARLVRDHMTKLGQKQYWQQFEPAPEFVVMFLGDESLFRAALDHDPSLLDAGVEAGVIPASPTTLIALLRTVAYGWQQETVAESARKVSKLGRELHDRLGVFTGHFSGVGKSLDAAVRNYNNAVGVVRDARARHRAQVPRARRRRRRAARGAAGVDAVAPATLSCAGRRVNLSSSFRPAPTRRRPESEERFAASLSFNTAKVLSRRH